MKKYTTWFSILLFCAYVLPASAEYFNVDSNRLRVTGHMEGDGVPYVDVRSGGTITFGSSPTTVQKTANAAAIQAAYDNLVATYGGGRLVFPAEKIIINTPINITSRYVTFEGQKGAYLLKGTEISGEGATPSVLFQFTVNAVDGIKFKDMTLSNAPMGILIPTGLYISNFYMENVKFIAITDKCIYVEDNTDMVSGGIVRAYFKYVDFYAVGNGFWANDGAMANNITFDDCYWGNLTDNTIGIRAGDGTYFVVKGGLSNGDTTTTHVPISIGYGVADIDALNFSDYGHTAGVNDNVPLIQVRNSATGKITSLTLRNIWTGTNYRGPLIAIEPGAAIYEVGIHNCLIDTVTGHTAATDNQVITNANLIDHLTVRDSQYNGGAIQVDSPDVTWSGNWGGRQEFWPTNVQRHWSGVALVVDQGGGALTWVDLGKSFMDNTGSGAVTYTLPGIGTYTIVKGARISFRKTDSGTGSVTISRSGADVIDGLTSIYLRKEGESVTLISDGTSNWYRERDFFKGAATDSVTDNSTISHGLGYEPSVVILTGTVAGEIVTLQAKSSTTITVDIKKRADGSAGTSQTIHSMMK